MQLWGYIEDIQVRITLFLFDVQIRFKAVRMTSENLVITARDRKKVLRQKLLLIRAIFGKIIHQISNAKSESSRIFIKISKFYD